MQMQDLQQPVQSRWRRRLQQGAAMHCLVTRPASWVHSLIDPSAGLHPAAQHGGSIACQAVRARSVGNDLTLAFGRPGAGLWLMWH